MHEFDAQDTVDQPYQTLKELGDCHTAVGNYEQATIYYRRAATMAPDAAGPYVGLGVIALQNDQIADARASFEIARRLDPNCSQAFGGLAMIHQQNENHQAAFDMYLKCLELDTDNLVALLGLFQASCQMGTFAKIIHYLELFLDMHPDDTAVLFCLASLYAKEGMFTQAESAVTVVLRAEPDKAEARELLAEIHREMQTGLLQGVGQS